MFANSMQKSDPSQDDVFNLLLVGSSGTYYYVEELHGLAKAAGIKMRICNVYYSGCQPYQHYNWWQEGKANYQLFTTDDNGRVESGKLLIGDEAVLDAAGVPDQKVYAAIRPEGFELEENGPFTCKLTAVEVMGRDISVVCTHEPFVRV